MEPRTYTEREKILAEQAAFRWGWNEATKDLGLNHDRQRQRDALLATRYLLPKVERPRVVHDPLYAVIDWSIDRGLIVKRERSIDGTPKHWRAWQSWNTDPSSCPIPSRVALWADLFQNPTELVDADGAET